MTRLYRILCNLLGRRETKERTEHLKVGKAYFREKNSTVNKIYRVWGNGRAICSGRNINDTKES